MNDPKRPSGLQVDIARRAALGSLAVASAACTVPAFGRGDDARATPEASSAAMDRAIVARDRATLDRLIAPDFVWVRGGGVRTDKAAFLAGFAAPGVVIAPFTPTEGRWLKSGELAIFSAVNELHGTDQGEVFVDRHSFCDVWRREAAVWQLVYAQITRAPA